MQTEILQFIIQGISNKTTYIYERGKLTHLGGGDRVGEK